MENEIAIGSLIFVEPTTSASRRTKNRIREHGPFFFMLDSAKSVQSLSGESGVLVQCHGSDSIIPNQESDWFGWLPESEINISKNI
jgi:hypothetical protein